LNCIIRKITSDGDDIHDLLSFIPRENGGGVAIPDHKIYRSPAPPKTPFAGTPQTYIVRICKFIKKIL
jgi:hypothetical protein